MFHARKGSFLPGERVACLQQRLVVAAAVVTHEGVESGEILSERSQRTCFLAMLPDKPLLQDEAFTGDARRPDQKGHGARPASETRRLRIQINPVPPAQFAQPLHQDIAMLIVCRVDALQLQVSAKRSLHFDAAKARRVIDTRLLYRYRKARIHLLDAPAQERKLRLKWTVQCS